MVNIGLGTALNTAVSGLTANQETIAIVSQNIANVNNPEYSRRIVKQVSEVINGVGQGVTIGSIERQLDPFLSRSVLNQNPLVSEATTYDTYNGYIQLLLGQPDSASALSTNINDFFSTIKSLQMKPEDFASRVDTVNKAQALSARIAEIALGLQKLRYQADQEIAGNVTKLNDALSSLRSTNASINNAYTANSDMTALYEQRDNTLMEISQYIDISTYYQPNGVVYINTAGGKALVDQSAYNVSYSQISSLQNVLNNSPFNSIDIKIVNIDGTTAPSATLISSGISQQAGVPSTVQTDLGSGSILALRNLRDSQIPLIIDQLDNFVSVLTDQMNAIHNSGGGYPPATSLTGTRVVSGSEAHDFYGQVRIAIVGENGGPVSMADGTLLPPLTMDLGALKSTTSSGQMTVQTIIDEINEYYYNSPVLNRGVLGNLYDIKMAATTDLSTEPNGQFSFDLEINNLSQLGSKVQITAVTVSDPGCAGLTSALPAVYTANAGARDRTGMPMTVNFAGGSGGPYLVNVALQVTDSAGNISIGTVKYQVNDNPGTLSLENTRIPAYAVAGNAQLVPAATTQRFAQASLVDETGVTIHDGITPGYLKIATSNSSYHIVIDDLDSKELGLPAGTQYSVGAISGTNRGFSYFFELNNFFVRNPNTVVGSSDAAVSGSALNMAVRPDILADSNLMSVGKLTQLPNYPSAQSVGETAAQATLVFDGNPAPNDTITLAGEIFTFVAAAVGNNQITIGATLPDTLTNMVAKVNASNLYTSGTVDQASYTTDDVNSLFITYKTPGLQGNHFAIAGNFNTVGVQLNGGILTTTPSGNLSGGADTQGTKINQSWGYGIYIGSNGTASSMVSLASKQVSFNSAGNLPASTSSFSGYMAIILSYTTTQSINATNQLSKQQIIYDGYYNQLQAAGGVNLDQEMSDILRYQQAYIAATRVMSITSELFDELFTIMK